MVTNQLSPTYSVSIAKSPLEFPPRQELFVDREQELARTLKFLNPYAAPRGIFIYGQGGVGKTTLAIEAAHQSWNRNDYDELVYLTAKVQYWDIEKRTNNVLDRRISRYHFASFNGMLAKLASLLNRGSQIYFRMQSKENKFDIIKSLLQERNVLMVIDNLDTIQSSTDLEDIAEFVNFALPPSCKALVTSRLQIKELTSAGFVSIALRSFDDTWCYTLLTELLEKKGMTLSHSSADRLLALLVESGGIPLIIKQVASMIIELGPDKTVRKLDGMQKSMLPFLFETSISRLSHIDRKILYTVALARSPLSERDLVTVLEIGPHIVQDAIDELEKWSLVSKDGRVYETHFLLRDYIVNILRKDIQLWNDINRLLKHFEEKNSN